jgi:hypothetical protein
VDVPREDFVVLAAFDGELGALDVRLFDGLDDLDGLNAVASVGVLMVAVLAEEEE